MVGAAVGSTDRRRKGVLTPARADRPPRVRRLRSARGAGAAQGAAPRPPSADPVLVSPEPCAFAPVGASGPLGVRHTSSQGLAEKTEQGVKTRHWHFPRALN